MHFMSLHYISQDNSINANHEHITLTGTDSCSSKLSKDIRLKKTFFNFFFNFSEELQENPNQKSYFGSIACCL